MPAVKSAMNSNLEADDTEIIAIIRQLHKTRREIWTKQREGQMAEHATNQRTASRRDQVFINLLFLKIKIHAIK